MYDEWRFLANIHLSYLIVFPFQLVAENTKQEGFHFIILNCKKVPGYQAGTFLVTLEVAYIFINFVVRVR